ncbi:MAG: NmrA family NAD(P)-binding protein [Spirochaetales bacterium]|nr:NmrA family NAD(P)-binding protein [Spirochaetales bacterium]
MKILVTGAGGNVGSYVVKYLEKRNCQIVAPKGRAEFSFTDSATWEGTLDGVSRVFLMRPPHISNIKKDMLPFLAYLKERKIEKIVFLSVQGAENNKLIPHNKIEKCCRLLDLPCIFLRPSFFMQNLTTTHLEEIRDDNMVFVPSGEGKTNFIDTEDIGQMAAALLTGNNLTPAAYTVTGSRSYSHREIAEHLSRGLGREIRFISPGPVRFIIHHLKKGRSLAMALVMLALYTVVKTGKGDITTEDSRQLLGRAPKELDDFIERHKSLLSREEP